jgi:hypothetical protein
LGRAPTPAPSNETLLLLLLNNKKQFMSDLLSGRGAEALMNE